MSWPLSGAHPCGQKLNANDWISPRKGSVAWACATFGLRHIMPLSTVATSARERCFITECSSFRLVFDRDGQCAVRSVRPARETDREIDHRQIRRFPGHLGIV